MIYFQENLKFLMRWKCKEMSLIKKKNSQKIYLKIRVKGKEIPYYIIF